MKNLQRFSFFFLSLLLIPLINFSAFATPTQGLFSDKNFEALQKDPQTLFSKGNVCRLKSLLGDKGFDLFSQSMALMTSEEDEPGYISISGNVRGLFTIFEGFFRMSKSGKIWIAYLYDNKVNYFTNDKTSLQQPPKKILDWSSRFEKVQWVFKFLTPTPDNCK